MKLKRVMRDWLQRSAWAGASLTVALGAGSASAAITAPTCTEPEPTLQQCLADGYLRSVCGQYYAQRCNDLIEAAFNEAWAALTEERVAKLPDALGGGVSTVRVSHHQDPSTIRVEGGTGTYVGTVLKNQLLHRKGFTNLNDSDLAQNALLTQWNTNGEQLTSCEEYVYEKYYDYSRFEDRLGRYGTDYRAIFNAAYASDGIANRDLRDRSGNVLGSVFGSQAIPKNLYFLAEQGPYPDGSSPYHINPELLALVPTAGRQFYTPTWSWNQQMSSSLQGYNDDELN
ncbi:hypothetical protein [Vitiosangium sp. GDMCC 1.1324]|uniref:hypothetical protein n=1 Tax=Vitiosangium sp. (strain GDMCC 1.1324) TaxID=2138576 RepID=UPI000D3C436F|nr:hypothetical protein [Vitiosangium sp. GDMCC 1.1324]PTL79155.1 hypothetical protein DAT35_36780 [Vitiosangium sp. GDMCC 1.1324]